MIFILNVKLKNNIIFALQKHMIYKDEKNLSTIKHKKKE